MRIGIDARFFGPRVGGGGIGRYVSELVNHLQEIDRENDYIIFLKRENFHAFSAKSKHFTKEMANIHWYTTKEQFEMPKIIKRARVDFMHFPHWNIPVFSRTPFITTIHDLILLEDQHSARSSTRHPFIHGFKYAGFRTVLENAIHRSKHIITVSHHTKSRLLEHFGVQTSKISVIHNGVSLPGSNQNIDLTTFGVNSPYFLYVGNAYPHKNLHFLIDAFSEIKDIHPDMQLVLAGKRDIFSKELEKYAYKLRIPKHQLTFIHSPDDATISTLYQSAQLFIYPSRIEGFGIPPLEAMLHKTPVAAANTSSLPEVLQKHAHYFDTQDKKALISIMKKFALSPELESKLQTSQKHAQNYSWEKTAQKTLEIYQKMPLLLR